MGWIFEGVPQKVHTYLCFTVSSRCYGFFLVSSFAVNTGHSRWEKGRIFLRRSKRETKFGVQLTGMDLNEEIWHISILLEAEEFQGCSGMFFFWWKYGVFGKPRSSQCWSLLFCTVSNIYKEIGNTHEYVTYLT